MDRRPRPWSALLWTLALACGPSIAARSPTPPPTSGAPRAVLADVAANLDRGVDPCTDFYRYACGGWLARTQLPPDAPIVSRSLEHIDAVMGDLHHLIADAPDTGAAGSLRRYYGACMDTAAVEADAPEAMATLLAMLGDPVDTASSGRALAELSLAGIEGLIVPSVAGDPSRPGHSVLYLDQGELPLGGREAYGERGLVDAYQALVALTLGAAGEPEPETRAAEIVLLEQRLAAREVTVAERRAASLSSPRTVAELDAEFPGVPWRSFFDGLGRPDLDRAIVTAPAHFAALGAVIRDTPPTTWRAHLRWLALQGHAHALARPVATAHFAFFAGRLRGQHEPLPRASTCVDRTIAALPDVVDRLWLAKRFDRQTELEARELATQIYASLEPTLQSTAWLDASTRGEAIRKARRIGLELGHPEHWPTAGEPSIGDGLVDNMLATSRWALGRALAQADRPIDPSAWRVPAITVGAFYDPTVNEMLIPAGILQPPYFVPDRPMAMNFGGIGVVIGHELTHGFDDRGRQSDAEGIARDWWTETSEQAFEARAECVERYYGRHEVVPGVRLDGAAVRSEAIADLGGLGLAFAAFLRWAREHDIAPHALTEIGLDHAQLFFVAFAQQSCEVVTPELAAARAARGVHPPPPIRINASLANTPEFASAFGCEPGEPMRPAEVCEVW
jgi:putative endopeptidase